MFEIQEWMKSKKLVLNVVLILLRYSLSIYFKIYPVLPLLTGLAVSWLRLIESDTKYDPYD